MMIYLFIAVWFNWNTWEIVNPISRNNQARRQAEAAYLANQFDHALALYSYLSHTTTPLDPAVRLNLGHTYFQLGQYQQARPQYETLLRSDRPDLRTVAATQLGIIACFQRDSSTALRLFEQALLEDSNNEPARYNFELLKKRYSGRTPTPKPARQPPRPATKPNPSGGRQVERSARQDEVLRRLKGLNMTEAQALQLLDAMQDTDHPYALTRAARRTEAKAGGNRW